MRASTRVTRSLVTAASLTLFATAASSPQDRRASDDDAFEMALQRTPAQRAPAGNDFEDALARTRTAAPPDRRATRRESGGRMNVAPAGALPAHWRGTRGIDRAAWRRAAREAEEGLLDPFAFAERVFGRLPLPPGASPARCATSIGTLLFTLGAPVSAEYDRALADYRQNGAQIGKPSFLLNHDKIAKTATAGRIAEVERFYTSNGFRRISDPLRIGRILFVRAGLPDGADTLQFEIKTNAFLDQIKCRQYGGAEIPSGPAIQVRIPPPR